MKYIKIAYLGGGSKAWAMDFMQDLALAEGLSGEVWLYDIDMEAAERNRRIAERINEKPGAKSKFKYIVAKKLGHALKDADFVLISILPGTFREMRSDVHAPEKYGILQPVGDTVGPGGVLRAMRTVPIYEDFAHAISYFCPNAWVLNLTNPMSACVKALYAIFPSIKAFGCCHCVFHAQEFLCCVLKEMKGIDATRDDIYTDLSGINHFTWITEARYQDIDILKLLPGFMERFFERGYYEKGDHEAWRTNPFANGNKVKMELFRRYGVLAATGDRHLVEFLNNNWFLDSRETPAKWHFGLTSVDYREAERDMLIARSIEMAEGRCEVPLAPSGEELVDLIKAIMGFGTVVSNVNMPNHGQMPGLPEGTIVETNCVFSHGFVKPVTAKPLPDTVLALVQRNATNIDMTCDGILFRDGDRLLSAFMNQPLCSNLTWEQGRELFAEMCENTAKYLERHYEWMM